MMILMKMMMMMMMMMIMMMMMMIMIIIINNKKILTPSIWETIWYEAVAIDVAKILPWGFYQIRKIAGCACTGMPGTFSPPPRVSDPDMHAGIAKWWFPFKSVAGKTFPAFPEHAQPAITRIWKLTIFNTVAWLMGFLGPFY